MVVIFFFKQKTAYEMRISDWSSDVCSSDLIDAKRPGQSLRRYATFDGADYHSVLLGRRQTTDPLVIGEGVVVGSDQTGHLRFAEVLQRLDPQVAVEQEVAAWISRISNDHRRFDQAHRLHRSENLPELRTEFHAGPQALHWC